MIDYDMETKVLETKYFPQHIIAGLYIWQYVHRSVQSGEAFSVDGNEHTNFLFYFFVPLKIVFLKTFQKKDR